MGKKKGFVFECPECGKTPPKDEKNSNENWEVYPTECPDCLCKLKMVIK